MSVSVPWNSSFSTRSGGESWFSWLSSRLIKSQPIPSTCQRHQLSDAVTLASSHAVIALDRRRVRLIRTDFVQFSKLLTTTNWAHVKFLSDIRAAKRYAGPGGWQFDVRGHYIDGEGEATQRMLVRRFMHDCARLMVAADHCGFDSEFQHRVSY